MTSPHTEGNITPQQILSHWNIEATAQSHPKYITAQQQHNIIFPLCMAQVLLPEQEICQSPTANHETCRQLLQHCNISSVIKFSCVQQFQVNGVSDHAHNIQPFPN